MENTETIIEGFATTGLSPVILSILKAVGLKTPTPIQERGIPVALTGVDMLGIAETGTGKTLAFALPLLDKLREEPGRALVIVPTRELALQVEESIRRISDKLSPRVGTVSLIGGASMNNQIHQLRYNPRIMIATPGRLMDHLEQRTVRLGDVNTLILDEADRMLDMGFAPQIKRIMMSVPEQRQTMLFSATMPPDIAKIAAHYMNDPVRVEVDKPGSANHLIEQQLCFVGQNRKPDILEEILARYQGSVLVFSRTKHGASKLNRRLISSGHLATEIHSNKSLGQRRQALEGFKSGRYRVLVATDVAARGIDVKDIALVVNYDLPDVAEDYVHRIGRTGRAGKTGLAISFADHDQYNDVRSIERLVNQPLKLSELSEERRETPVRQYTGGRGSGRGGSAYSSSPRRRPYGGR